MTNPLTEPPRLDWPAPLMTVAEVAAVLRVTPKTIRLHIRRGTLRAAVRRRRPAPRARADAQEWAERQLAAGEGTRAVDRYARQQEAAAGSVGAPGRRRSVARVSA